MKNFLSIDVLKLNFIYGFIFLFLFFSGFDNFLLYQRTFEAKHHYEYVQYIHFGISSFGAWFIGYFVYRKIIEQYRIDFILKLSLVISAFSAWVQFKYMYHSMGTLTSETIIYNFFLNLNLSCLSYSLFRVMEQNKIIVRIRQSVFFLAPVIFLTYLYSHIFNSSNLMTGFLASSLIYLIGFAYFYFLSIQNSIAVLEKNIRLKKNSFYFILGVAFCFFTIWVFIQLIKNNFFTHHLNIFSHQYFLFFYLFCLIVAAKNHEKHKITAVELSK